MSADAPLRGRRIVVTRRAEQAGRLAELLRAAGAEVAQLDAIAILPAADPSGLDAALRQLHVYNWIAFTSANAVTAVAERLAALALDRAPVGRGTEVAVVGPATAEAFADAFQGADIALRPREGFRAEGLLAALRERGVRGERFLLPLSDQAADTLAEGLSAAGARVDAVAAYQTAVPEHLAEDLADILVRPIDALVFASPSAVDNLASAAGSRVAGLPAAAIGPVTAEAVRRAGMTLVAVAEPSTDAGLVEALTRGLAGLTPGR